MLGIASMGKEVNASATSLEVRGEKLYPDRKDSCQNASEHLLFFRDVDSLPLRLLRRRRSGAGFANQQP